uniref:Uncharacterized protein n=1 Tax=Arundo donax TaxID=35708 RepID=A0A0A9GH40_ARUDO
MRRTTWSPPRRASMGPQRRLPLEKKCGPDRDPSRDEGERRRRLQR